MKKMFILVRKDLESPYKFVQGAHALAQYALEHTQDFNEWNNQTIVFVNVKDETALYKWKDKLYYSDKKISVFTEPDINDQLTAIACYDEGGIFKNLQVAK